MSSEAKDADVNQLLEAARVPTSVIAAAIALAGSGLLVALVALQNLWLVHWLDWYAYVPWALLALGAGAIVVGAKVHRARAWSLPAGIAAAALLTLGQGGFFALSTMSGVFSLLGLLAAGGAIAALVLVLVAAGPFRALVATRQKLRSSGFDLDL